MSYSTVAGVQAYFGGISFSLSTHPTSTEVEQWATEAASIIDSYISPYYIVPVTATTDLNVLKSISDAFIVDNINFVLSKGRTSVMSGDTVQREVRHKYFYEQLDRICNGEIVLSNTTRATTYTRVYSGAVENNSTFVANKDNSQW